jgi:hypothetical protein
MAIMQNTDLWATTVFMARWRIPRELTFLRKQALGLTRGRGFQTGRIG